MFRPRHRRPSFTDPLNWTDYRWHTGPWHGGGHAAARTPFGRRQRSSGFARLLLAGLALFIGARLFSSLQSRNGSWARRGLYAVILLMIAGAFSRNRGRGYW